MANYIEHMTANSPWIHDADAVTELISEYEFLGSFGSPTVAVHRDQDDNPYLAIHGDAGFQVRPHVEDIPDDADQWDPEYDRTREFLERLAPHLEETLKIQVIGREKNRYPFTAYQWTLEPNGEPEFKQAFE